MPEAVAPAAPSTASSPAAPATTATPSAASPSSGSPGVTPGASSSQTSEPTTMAGAIDAALGFSKSATEKPEGEGGEPEQLGDEHEGREDSEDQEVREPAGMAPEQRQAFARLRHQNSQMKKKLAEVQQRYQQNDDVITSFRSEMSRAGMTPERFSQALAYTEFVQRGDFESAKKVLMQQLQQLSLAMGAPIEGVNINDVLEGQPDLVEDLENYRVTPERALEIARQRRAEEARRSEEERRQQATQRQHQEHQTRQQAVDSIDKWTRERKGKDVDYKAKEDRILARPNPNAPAGPQNESVLERIQRKFPPGQWLEELQYEYDRIVLAPPRVGGGPAPLGGVGSGPGGAPEPKSMREAIDRKLGFSQ